ncbi:hypothetical protein [Umezawaea sp. NPDC059074]|uniref:hypothetical protein n=1 Tax=Umezawaea sp. NPDC059074 TaxID=3346716 RepID=UPI00367D0F70
MIKKLGAVVAATAAGMVMLGGMASATTGAPHEELPTPHGHGGVGNTGSIDSSDLAQVGLVNLNNTDVLHNTNVVAAACDNNINVLGVQVPVEDVANGLDVPVLSPGANGAESVSPDICGAGGIVDGGIGQSN